MQLNTSFNVSLVRRATIPMTLRLNSMCQISSFEMSQFNNATGGAFIINAKRGGVDCPTVAYCDNNGNAGSVNVCPGTVHQLVDSACVNNLWSATQSLVAESTMSVLESARNFTEDAIAVAIAGMNATMQNMMDGISNALTSQITEQEATLSQCIVDSAASVTNNVNKEISNLASTVSATISTLQSATNKQFRDATYAIDGLAAALTNSVNDLQLAISNTNILLGNRVSSLSEYVDAVINSVNNNEFMQSQNLNALMMSLQQIAVQLERVSRYAMEGDDISPLLARWESMDKTDVFQAESISAYKYVSDGLLGIYSNATQSTTCSPDVDIVDTVTYVCYEQAVSTPLPQASTKKVIVHSSAAAVCPYSSLYDLLLVSLCNNTAMLSNILSDKAVTDLALTINSGVPNVRVTHAGLVSTIDPRQSCVSTYVPPSTSNATRADSGRYVTLAVNDESIISNVKPDVITTTYLKQASFESQLRTTTPACGSMIAYSRLDPVVRSTQYGTQHFIVAHPTMGNMQIHRCVKLNFGQYNPVTDYTDSSSTVYAITDSQGMIAGLSPTLLPGSLVVPSYGSMGNRVTLIVRASSDTWAPPSSMLSTMYYFTQDMWCCDDIKQPVLTVSAITDCEALGYNVCYNTMFGECSTSSSFQLEQLLLSGSSYRCPSGYSPTPSNIIIMYKSPRMYYCSSDRKYREPYGIEMTYCTTSTIMLPGAGVRIASGIMAPAGMYPATCIFWNSVSGNVPLYDMHTDFEGMVVPTMLNELSNQRLAYYYGDGIVVDERDRLYGNQNSGYDCITYEMDQILHNPDNCVNFDIPTYDLNAYFSDRVRSSGVSALLDYFDITPIPTDTGLTLVFDLKAGIDYETAYIQHGGLCPRLSVEYSSNPDLCILSGWNVVSSNTIINVAGIDVCTTRASCITSLTVADGASLNVTATSNGETTLCNTFKCYASTNTFVAYSVTTFQEELLRPNLGEFIAQQSDDDYTQQLANALDEMASSIAQSLSTLSLVNLSTSVNISINVVLTYPNLTDAIQRFQTTVNASIVELQHNLDDVRNAMNSQFANTSESVSQVLSRDYGVSLSKLQHILDSYNNSVNFIPSSGSSGQFSMGTLGSLSISSGVIATLALVLAVISLVIQIYQCSKLPKRSGNIKLMSVSS